MGVTRDELHTSRRLTMSQRNLLATRRALRGGNPRHHLNVDAGRATRLDFLGRATEDHRISTLEADDTFALGSERDHQAIDFVLFACGAAAGLADHHLLRLAPRKI